MGQFFIRFFFYFFTITFIVHNVRAYTHFPELGVYYKFYQQSVNWLEAKKICESDGALLAMPIDEIEAVNIVNMTKANDTLFVHLGFHSLLSSSNANYISISGKMLQYYYNNWAPMEPNNQNVEKCVLVNQNVQLFNANCNNFLAAFVCEKDTNKRRSQFSNPKCDTSDSEYHLKEYAGKCYKIHIFPMMFQDANQICISEGGHLAITRNSDEEKFLNELMKRPKYKNERLSTLFNHATLGIHKMFGDSYKTVLNEDYNNINWAPGRPNSPNTEKCVAIHAEFGKMDDIDCLLPNVFICEKPAKNVIDSDRNNFLNNKFTNPSSERFNINLFINATIANMSNYYFDTIN